MSSKHHIGGGLPQAGAGIGIRAQQTSRLTDHEVTPVGGLANNGVRRREVHDEGGTCKRMRDAGRLRRPQVLAHLGRDHKIGHRLARKELVRPKQHLAQGSKLLERYLGLARLEVPCLVELVVVGHKALRHDA